MIYQAHQFLQQHNFITLEKPILSTNSFRTTKTSDFYPEFIYNAISTAASFNRHYQISRRLMTHADGHESEQTLVDMATSFTDEKQICILAESLISTLLTSINQDPLLTPIQNITYTESIRRFGTDTHPTLGIHLKSSILTT